MRKAGILLLCILFLISCNDDATVSGNGLIHHIPESSKIIVHTDDLEPLQKWLSGNELLDQVKELSRLQEIKKAARFIEDYRITKESFLTLSIEGKNETVITLITKDHSFNQPESDIVDSLQYNGATIYSKNAESSYFFTDFNGVHIASSSRLVVESLLRRSLKDYVFDDDFSEIYERTGNSNLSIYFKGSNDEWLKQYLAGNNINDNTYDGLWYQTELNYYSGTLQLDGIITYRDSIKMYQGLFNKIIPHKNIAVNITPLTTTKLTSVTYTDVETLFDNLDNYHVRNEQYDASLKDILNNSQELGQIEISNKTALAFTLKPYENLFINLDSLSTEKYTYRNQQIHTVQKPLETKNLSPLINTRTYPYVSKIEDFLIFAQESKTLESIISNFQNKTTIGNQQWWNEATESLSDESSVLKLYNIETLSQTFSSSSNQDQKLIRGLDEETYPFWISQYVHEDEYAHFHFQLPHVNSNNDRSKTSQLMTYRSDAAIISGPFLFPNHITKKHDVAFQDEQLNLVLVNATGKLMWSKKLDSPIQGEIVALDGYKNGRKQMAFATKKSVYYLDRNGKDLNAFPQQITGGITQPLSVFDYDKNRNYRFLSTSDKKLMMFNINGDQVSGFKYKPDAVIKTQPKHFRYKGKDYICFAKDDNSIAILSRVGKNRTNVKEKVEVIGTLYQDNNKILVVTNGSKLKTINLATGNVSNKDLTLKSNDYYILDKDVEIVQSNNVLKINGKQIDLPYGTYSKATIQLISNTPYFTIVENGENKIYVFNSEGETISGLPVYGSKGSEIAKSNVRYLVTSDTNDVILYKW